MDLSSVLESFSEEDMQKLKETAQQFFGGKTKEEGPSNINENNTAGFDPKILMNVAKFSSMMQQSDERCDFLLALKPLLTEKRKKKADDAIIMLKFMKIINLFGETGL